MNGLMSLADTYEHLPPHERMKRIVAAVTGGRPARSDDVTLMVIEGGA